MVTLVQGVGQAGLAEKSSQTNRIVAEAIGVALQRHGVELMVAQCAPMATFFHAPEVGIKQLVMRTENAGAMIADAYARISGKVGVVGAMGGPGAALLVPGLAEAYSASVPIVALIEDAVRENSDKNEDQHLVHADLFSACSKWVRTVTRADRVDDYVDMAFTAAASGRPGPAVLCIPADFEFDPAAGDSARSVRLGEFPLDRSVANPELIGVAADLIAQANRPLVVSGGGVHLSRAHAEVAELQDTASLPVGTTCQGKGSVDENHPLSIGVVGYMTGRLSMTEHNRSVVGNADVVLLIGNRTNQKGTGGWSAFPRTARFIHIDVDSLEVGRSYEAIRLVGDAKLTLRALIDALRSRDLTRRSAKRSELESKIKAGKRMHAAEVEGIMSSDDRPIRPERLMADINRVLTPETIVVSDASFSTIWMANYLHSLKAGMRFIAPRGQGGLGWGMPGAIGAKLARPSSPVIALAGDGGFGHMWSELETCRRNAINVVMIVLNNSQLSYQTKFEDLAFGRHTPGGDLFPVDHAAVARACGCNGVRVESPQEFLPSLKKALCQDQLTLIEVLTDPDAVPPIGAIES